MIRMIAGLLCLLSIGYGVQVSGGESLYDEREFHALTHDRRAFRLGDSLTVLVFESSSASANANTETAKNGSVGVGVESSKPEWVGNAKLKLSEDLTGRGKISRSGKLAAQITVTVQSITPNGDLQVAGKQLIHVNDEKQEITLKGRVRPQDISEANTVVSSRLADASISYLGEGVLAEKQKPGIITRFLSWLGLL